MKVKDYLTEDNWSKGFKYDTKHCLMTAIWHCYPESRNNPSHPIIIDVRTEINKTRYTEGSLGMIGIAAWNDLGSTTFDMVNSLCRILDI